MAYCKLNNNNQIKKLQRKSLSVSATISHERLVTHSLLTEYEQKRNQKFFFETLFL